MYTKSPIGLLLVELFFGAVFIVSCSFDSSNLGLSGTQTKIDALETQSTFEQRLARLTLTARAVSESLATPLPPTVFVDNQTPYASSTDTPAIAQTPTPTQTPRSTEVSLPVCIEVNCLAPDFTLADEKGDLISLKDFRGKKLLLNFWATWCSPCKSEMPFLELLYEKYKDKNFVVLGIATDEKETIDDVPDFLIEYRIEFPVLLDSDLSVATRYQASFYTRGLPFTFYIDENGVIKDFTEGKLDIVSLEKKISLLLNGDLYATPTPLPDSTLQISNKTDRDICYVYIRRSSEDAFGENLIDGQRIPTTGSFSFELAKGSYDIRVLDCDGTPLSQNTITVMGLYQYNIELNATITITNNLDKPICTVRISLSSIDDWGSDWLPAGETIDVSSSRTFRLFSGQYDIDLRDCDDNQLYSRTKVELQDLSVIVANN